MKSIIVTFLCLFFYSDTFSQALKLEQLFEIQSANVVDAEDIILALGFKPTQANEEGEEYDIYSFVKSINNGNNSIYINKYVYEGRNIKVSFFTNSLLDYNLIKKSIESFSFDYSGTRKINSDLTVHTYDNNRSSVIQLISYVDDEDVAGFFVVVKNKLREHEYLNRKKGQVNSVK